MIRVALFPGTFDPFTRGHADIVSRGLVLFDKVIIGVGVNTNKCATSLEFRCEYIQGLYKNDDRVEVQSYDGLTVDFAKRCGVCAILRGIRDVKDYEYERAIDAINKDLNGDIETVFLFASPQLAHISSSMVRELQHYNKDIDRYLVEK